MLEHLVHGPPYYTRVIGIVAEERYARHYRTHLVGQSSGYPCESASLAVSAAEDAGGVGLGERRSELYRTDDVAECSAIVEVLLAVEAAVYPPVLVTFENTLVAHAYGEVDAVGIPVGIVVVDVGSVAHEIHPYWIAAFSGGDVNDSAHSGAAPGRHLNPVALAFCR